MEKKMEKKTVPPQSSHQKSLYKPRMTWIKLYADEWLRGSTRFELSPAERGVFVDLMAMAGLSRWPGLICAGAIDNNGNKRGYPKQFLCGTMVISEELFDATIDKCQKYDKVKVTHDSYGDLIIEVVNFTKYQTEYLRQKIYRQKKEQLPDETVEDFKERYEGKFKKR